VAACRFEDSLGGEWLLDGMVWVHLLEAFSNNVLNAGVEPFEENSIVALNRNGA